VNRDRIAWRSGSIVWSGRWWRVRVVEWRDRRAWCTCSRWGKSSAASRQTATRRPAAEDRDLTASTTPVVADPTSTDTTHWATRTDTRHSTSLTRQPSHRLGAYRCDESETKLKRSRMPFTFRFSFQFYRRCFTINMICFDAGSTVSRF